MLSNESEQEIEALARRYGRPRRVLARLEGRPFRPLTARDRTGEVCMVVRRRNGQLLTAVKTYYPPGAFRLLTGGVSIGETIEAALLREVEEETGLEVAIRRFLAVIEYSFRAPEPVSRTFATFVFLLDELAGTLEVRDESEQHAAFREAGVAELPAIAEALERVDGPDHPDIEGAWRDWGRFRAIVHRVVYEALEEPGCRGEPRVRPGARMMGDGVTGDGVTG
jgi:ADP-ribose pyrophosphatase YjhB (NUDIX family)